MARRKRTKRFDSEEVQGEDSFVVVSFRTVAEQRATLEARDKAEADGKPFNAFHVGIDILRNHILQWNWVDDDGKLLPQVPDNPEVVEILLDPEVSFLGKCIQGSEAEAKN